MTIPEVDNEAVEEVRQEEIQILKACAEGRRDRLVSPQPCGGTTGSTPNDVGNYEGIYVGCRWVR